MSVLRAAVGDHVSGRDQGETMLMATVHAATGDHVDVHDRGDHVDGHSPCCHTSPAVGKEASFVWC